MKAEARGEPAEMGGKPGERSAMVKRGFNNEPWKKTCENLVIEKNCNRKKIESDAPRSVEEKSEKKNIAKEGSDE